MIEARDPRRREFGTITIAFAKAPGAPAGLTLQGWNVRDAGYLHLHPPLRPALQRAGRGQPVHLCGRAVAARAADGSRDKVRQTGPLPFIAATGRSWKWGCNCGSWFGFPPCCPAALKQLTSRENAVRPPLHAPGAGPFSVRIDLVVASLFAENRFPLFGTMLVHRQAGFLPLIGRHVLRPQDCFWNINSIRARVEIVEKFLAEECPDILCLQETKVRDADFPEGLFRRKHNTTSSSAGGRCITASPSPAASRSARMPGSTAEPMARPGTSACASTAASGSRMSMSPLAAIPDRRGKFGQKLDFIERMTRWSETCTEPTILVGDLNVAPLEYDVWSHKQLLNVVSHTPVEVEALTRLQHSSWVDLGRQFVRRPSACSPGGALAPTSPGTTAAGGSTICGRPATSPGSPSATASTSRAATGRGRPTMCR